VATNDKRFDDAVAAYARAYAAQPSAIAASRESVVRGAAGIARPDQPLLNWLGRNPGDLGARRQLSEFYLRTGALADAAAQLEKVIVAAPNDVGALNNLAWALTKSDSKRAELFARRANAIDPKSPPIADTLGWLLAQTKRYAEARPFLEMAAKGMPKDATVQYHLAVALAGSGDKSAAKQLLGTVLAGDTKFEERAAAQQLAQELGQ
jgi:Tfp pilus assembly protein PilF